jgi:hypothetical protein
MFLLLFGFTILLHNFFYFFTDLKIKLLSNHIRETDIDSILSKILLFDVFWDYSKEGVKNSDRHLIITKERLQGLKGLRNNYLHHNNNHLKNNFTISFSENKNYSRLKNITTLTANHSLYSSELISTDFNNNIIYKEILNLFMPIFFLCVIYLFKV